MDAVVFADIGYFEAWERWLDHQSLSGETLWGVEIFWWGRIGKVLQLVGGLTVVAEWVGDMRMKEASDLLRRGHLPRVAGRAWQSGKEGLRQYLRLLRGASGPAGQVVTSVITAIVALAGIVPAITSSDVTKTVVTLIVAALLLPVVAIALLMVAALLGRVLDFILVRPLAFLLGKSDAIK